VEQFVEQTVFPETSAVAEIVHECTGTVKRVRTDITAHSGKTGEFYTSTALDVHKFAESDFVIDKSTGRTPAKKVYRQVEQLIMTQPHEVLIDDFYNNSGVSDETRAVGLLLLLRIFNASRFFTFFLNANQPSPFNSLQYDPSPLRSLSQTSNNGSQKAGQEASRFVYANDAKVDVSCFFF
jgi:hypothetical protein